MVHRVRQGLRGNGYEKSWSYHFLFSFNIKSCWPATGPRPCWTGNPACSLLGAHRGLFLAELREAVHAAACEPCVIATSKRLPSAPIFRQSRGVHIHGYRARQILSGSPREAVRCSARDLFGQSLPPATNQARQYRHLAERFHRQGQESLRSGRLVATSCADASARG